MKSTLQPRPTGGRLRWLGRDANDEDWRAVDATTDARHGSFDKLKVCALPHYSRAFS